MRQAAMIARHHTVIDELRARLAEPQRVYHGQAHVDALLHAFAAQYDSFHLPETVELAIWFHDAVYQPGAADNERRSAALLRDRMSGLVSAPTLAVAEAMVLATERHAVPSGLSASLEADLAAFLDMDMAVLGSEPTDYDCYARDVAAEFIPVVGEDAYRLGRTAFLRDILDGGAQLFHTARARDALDDRARTNLRRELSGLAL